MGKGSVIWNNYLGVYGMSNDKAKLAFLVHAEVLCMNTVLQVI